MPRADTRRRRLWRGAGLSAVGTEEALANGSKGGSIQGTNDAKRKGEAFDLFNIGLHRPQA